MKNVKILLDNQIDFYASLELLGDVNMYNETLGDFYEEIDNIITKLNDLFKENNLKDYSIVAHDLKSNSKYLGFKDLAEMAYNHELMSKSNDSEYVSVNIEKLLEEIKRIQKVIKEYLEG